jgi:hypothetical protein
MDAPRNTGLPHQPEEKEAHRRVLWLAENDLRYYARRGIVER